MVVTQRFQSTLPGRGATTIKAYSTEEILISIHAPRAGSDRDHHRGNGGRRISIHAPRAGSDISLSPTMLSISKFQSTLPGRGATKACQYQPQCSQISIHAPRAGSDRYSGRTSVSDKTFQSTLPGRGATAACALFSLPRALSIHAPRAGSDSAFWHGAKRCDLSIHAPRAGSDSRDIDIVGYIKLSIHAPRAGSDTAALVPGEAGRNFNPRSPGGERLSGTRCFLTWVCGFQSTLPGRGATQRYKVLLDMGMRISIHAPRAGSD